MAKQYLIINPKLKKKIGEKKRRKKLYLWCGDAQPPKCASTSEEKGDLELIKKLPKISSIIDNN